MAKRGCHCLFGNLGDVISVAKNTFVPALCLLKVTHSSVLEILINGNFQNKTQQRISKVIKSLETLAGLEVLCTP